MAGGGDHSLQVEIFRGGSRITDWVGFPCFIQCTRLNKLNFVDVNLLMLRAWE